MDDFTIEELRSQAEKQGFYLPDDMSREDILQLLSSPTKKIKIVVTQFPIPPTGHSINSEEKHKKLYGGPPVSNWDTDLTLIKQIQNSVPIPVNPRAIFNIQATTQKIPIPQIRPPNIVLTQPPTQKIIPPVPQPPLTQPPTQKIIPPVPQPPVAQPPVPQPPVAQPPVPQPPVAQPPVPQPPVAQPPVAQPAIPQPTVPQPAIPQPAVAQPAVAQPAIPRPTVPQAAIPKPTVPQAAIPKPTVPQPAIPQPTVPQAATPQPTVPQPAIPRPAVPHPTITQPVVPHPTIPQPIVQQPTVPQPTMPRPTIPQATIPRPAIPQAIVPRPAIPQATIPRPAIPQATIPRPAIPQATMPRPAIPQATMPRPPVLQPTAPKLMVPTAPQLKIITGMKPPVQMNVISKPKAQIIGTPFTPRPPEMKHTPLPSGLIEGPVYAGMRSVKSTPLLPFIPNINDRNVGRYTNVKIPVDIPQVMIPQVTTLVLPINNEIKRPDMEAIGKARTAPVMNETEHKISILSKIKYDKLVAGRVGTKTEGYKHKELQQYAKELGMNGQQNKEILVDKIKEMMDEYNIVKKQ